MTSFVLPSPTVELQIDKNWEGWGNIIIYLSITLKFTVFSTYCALHVKYYVMNPQNLCKTVKSFYPHFTGKKTTEVEM